MLGVIYTRSSRIMQDARELYTPHWIPGTLLLSRGCGVVFVVVVVVVFLF